MSSGISMPAITLVSGWVSRDLMFIFNSPPLTGPLANYIFHMIIESDGDSVYEDPLDRPDAQGRIYARGKDIDPRGGVIILSGLYNGQFDISNDKINPAIIGRCPYKQDHGRYLTFNVDPVVVQSGSTNNGSIDTTTRSDPALGTSGTATVAPGGVGASTSMTVTQPGDQRARANVQGQTLNVTSVRSLNMTQISAPRHRR